MVISYSGIVNYGKVTLPSVESWNTNMNILRDPPKSITTRKIDKVGETSIITTTIDESADRACEAINYYARGINPMVSISYGNEGNNAGQRAGSILNKSAQKNAFLPYTIMKDGAFRPPILRQEDLLPLSRLPRVWTYMHTQPYAPIFTKRIKNCGTCEETKEVRNKLLKKSCESCKIVMTEPEINEPILSTKFVKNPLIPSVTTTKSLNTNIPLKVYDINLNKNYPNACGNTNMKKIKEHPIVFNYNLNKNYPNAYGDTNMKKIKEHPIVFNYNLNSNRPVTTGCTNLVNTGNDFHHKHQTYDLLPKRLKRDSFDPRPNIPSIQTEYPTKNLIKVR